MRTDLRKGSAWSLLSAGVLLGGLLACGKNGKGREQPPEPPPEIENHGGSPTAEWDADELNRLQIAGAHILFTHAESQPFASILELPPSASTRARADALDRAREVTALAQANPDPEKFAKLARTYSEDVYTIRYGGQFGVTGAAGLPDEVADAFIGMKEGEVRGPVESLIGVHVLLRLPVPAEVELSGRSLVIAYSGVPEPPFDDPSQTAERSRAEAQAIAENLLAQARRAPKEFANLVRRHSDGLRAADGGYLGVWSSTDPISRTPHLTLPLLELAEDEISGVVETPFGFQIFQRLRPAPPVPLGASLLVIGFQEPGVNVDEAPGPTRTRAEAEALALQLSETLRKEPGRFGELVEQHSDGDKEYGGRLPPWNRGDGPADVELALEQMPIGGISKPLLQPGWFAILRRDAPAP